MNQFTDVDRHVAITLPTPVLGSLRWPRRPTFIDGNVAWTYWIDCGPESFAVQVGQTENGRPHPFEVWATGAEQPRVIGAVAKILSADMRTQDRAWLLRKLTMLQTVQGRKQIELPFPNRPCLCSSASAALATVLRFRLQQLNVETPAPGEATPLTDALLADEEPATGPEGTLSWAVDVKDPGAGDDFTVFVKEAQTRFGRLPFAVRIAGRYPEELDGLCELLSMDMRIIDVAWIGMKLAALVDYAEPLGRFIARVPGAEQSEMQPSVVAYIAKLLLFRYRMLGLLTAEAKPVHPIGVMVEVEGDTQNVVSFNARAA